jgi:hypothetical protein
MDFGATLTAGEEQLVALFCRIKPAADANFIAKISSTARQPGVNNAQLVCALGFNKHVRELTDILPMPAVSQRGVLRKHAWRCRSGGSVC